MYNRSRNQDLETSGERASARTTDEATRDNSPLIVVVATIMVAGILTLLASVLSGHAADSTGDYTADQAASGGQIFSQYCASCHGANLQGQAGPALAGAAFASSLAYSKMTATQFYNFISTQMPADHPGELSQAQYADVLAYLLSRNGYPSGQQPVSGADLGQIQLLPYPGSGQKAPSAQ